MDRGDAEMAIPVKPPTHISRKLVEMIFRLMPLVGRGKMAGTRVDDRIDLRMPVYLCELCNRKRLKARGNAYGLVTDVTGKPRTAYTRCTACNADFSICHQYYPEEKFRKVHAPWFGLKKPQMKENRARPATGLLTSGDIPVRRRR